MSTDPGSGPAPTAAAGAGQPMPLKACPSCGAMAPPLVTTCAFCGSGFPAAWAPTPPPGATQPASSPAWGAPAAAPAPTAGPATIDPSPVGSLPAGPTFVPAGPTFVPAGVAPPSPLKRARTWWIIGLVATVVVVGLVGVSVAVGMNAVSDQERTALDGDGTWQTFSDPDGAFLVDLPAAPYVGPVERTGTVTSRTYAATVGRAQFTVQTHDIAGWGTGVAGEQLLAMMPDLMVEQTGGTHNDGIRTSAGGLPAIQFDIDAGDEKWSVTAVLTGGRMIFLAAGGPAVAVGAHARMVESFVPLAPR